jgi:hypothetical protein
MIGCDQKLCYISLVFIILLIFLIKKNVTEKFIGKQRKKRVMTFIINGFNNKNDNYIGLFEPKDGDTNNLVYCASLETDEWIIPKNNPSLPDSGFTLINLTYDKDRRLFGIGRGIKDGNETFNIYRKKTSELKSAWEKIETDTPMRYLINDLDGILMGCSDEGQLFKLRVKASTETNYIWDGPFGHGVPMKSLIFDKDLYLLGVGLEDNNIYKRKGFFWKDDDWDTEHINNQEVYHIIHDKDGRFIATTKYGLFKQVNSNYMATFKRYNLVRNKKGKTLNLNDILKYKTGLSLVNSFIINEADNYKDIESSELKKILDFKKQAKDMCYNKTNVLSTNGNPILSQNISKLEEQSQTIDDLESMISKYEDRIKYKSTDIES